MTVVAIVLMVVGVFFLAVSAFGLVRFPDFYTRAHVVAKSESLGVAAVILGVIVYHRGGEDTLKLVLLVLFALVANPTAIHALSRAHRLQRVPVEPDAHETGARGVGAWVETIDPADGTEPTDPAEVAEIAEIAESDPERLARLAELDDPATDRPDDGEVTP